jgi:hypothetical protein
LLSWERRLEEGDSAPLTAGSRMTRLAAKTAAAAAATIVSQGRWRLRRRGGGGGELDMVERSLWLMAGSLDFLMCWGREWDVIEYEKAGAVARVSLACACGSLLGGLGKAWASMERVVGGVKAPVCSAYVRGQLKCEGNGFYGEIYNDATQNL